VLKKTPGALTFGAKMKILTTGLPPGPRRTGGSATDAFSVRVRVRVREG
jgi:hypothetical protein